MSIADDEQQLPSITEGDRALELFTDRYSFSRLLAERLNDDPAEKSILFFHGPGGNGKSLLLKYLRKNICKRLTASQWQVAKAKSDEELANGLEELQSTQHLAVPSALLDFGLTLVGEAQPRDRFYGLLLLRKALGESAAGSVPNWKLTFPRYDFACIWYLHSKGKSPEEIKSLFPLGKAAGVATAIIDAVTKNPAGAIVNAFFSLVSDQAEQKVPLYLSRMGLKKEDFEVIRGLDVDRELIERLPEYFARDLNGAMAAEYHPQRLALFFDTHEAFWGERRNLPREQNFFQDEWLRRLLRQLDLEKGIVPMVAGRDIPQWPGAKTVKPGTDIPAKYLQCVNVGNLSAADAAVFLQKIGIEDGALRDSLIIYASVTEDAVHPLHLGLCADVVLEAKHNGNPLSAEDFETVPDAFDDKSIQLIERLLRYVDSDLRYAIHALSACRAFDFEIYRLLGEKLSFTADRPTFNRLLRFSFVWQTEQHGTDWYRIHDLMRRLDNEKQVQAAHQVLAKHYQAEKNLEEIYHNNQLDSSQGINLWADVFDEALQLSRYDLCRTLLDMRCELTISSYFELGRISKKEGEYYSTLSLYSEAQREYQEAIDAYEQDLQKDPNNIAILNNKGNALSALAYVQGTLSQYDDATETYRLSINTFDDALVLAPEYTIALLNKGKALDSVATLQGLLSQYDDATDTCQLSIDTLDDALEHAPDNIITLLNKGNSILTLAGLQAALSQYDDAVDTYQLSIDTFDDVLVRIPNNISALNRKVKALLQLAGLQAALSQYDDALETYRLSIDTLDKVLESTPDNIIALENKGNSLQNLADLQVALSQYNDAMETYRLSIKTLDDALIHSPNNIVILNYKGISLQSLADLQAVLSKHDDALETYRLSIKTLDDALTHSPDFIDVLNNKGNSLSKLADLQAALSQNDDALENYRLSIKTFDDTLEHAPDFIEALGNKGSSLACLADLQASLSQNDDALDNYRLSIKAFDDTLEHAPNKINTLHNKGNSLSKLADLQASLSQNNDALDNYRLSIEAFDDTLEHAPKHILTLKSKGTTCLKYGFLCAQQNQPEQASELISTGISYWDRSLELAPGNSALQKRRDQLVAALEETNNNAEDS
ncbi:MAG: hypothetical protein AAF821_07170 [Cyanobacteria bacterium P01_D01_bin.156]